MFLSDTTIYNFVKLNHLVISNGSKTALSKTIDIMRLDGQKVPIRSACNFRYEYVNHKLLYSEENF